MARWHGGVAGYAGDTVEDGGRGPRFVGGDDKSGVIRGGQRYQQEQYQRMASTAVNSPGGGINEVAWVQPHDT